MPPSNNYALTQNTERVQVKIYQPHPMISYTYNEYQIIRYPIDHDY